MFSIPLYVFLFLYFAFLFVFIFFSTVNLLHIFQTGGITLLSFVVTLVVGTVAIYTLFLTWYFLQGTDWQHIVEILPNWGASNNQFGI